MGKKGNFDGRGKSNRINRGVKNYLLFVIKVLFLFKFVFETI